MRSRNKYHFVLEIEMAFEGVKVTQEVWLTCVTHALSTETEEIMGLLLGDIQYSFYRRACRI